MREVLYDVSIHDAHAHLFAVRATFAGPFDGGVLDLSPSLDHVGTVSATVGEAALTLDVLSGRAGQQATKRMCSCPTPA